MSSTGDSSEKTAFPFCSARCRAIDLGRWLSETYRIPGPPVEHEDEPARRAEEEPES
ncbi:MAG: DNA gyrase inhibitor YacG [Deltaproteobacteria bacterium]|nr:DNA gyrase inhibitor YacG [Deltaproteobacteria bacterium]